MPVWIKWFELGEHPVARDLIPSEILEFGFYFRSGENFPTPSITYDRLFSPAFII